MQKDEPYSVEPSVELGRFDVVRREPTVVAKELRWDEAFALAQALNEENRER